MNKITLLIEVRQSGRLISKLLTPVNSFQGITAALLYLKKELHRFVNFKY